MVGEDTVTMRAKELRRVHVLRQVRDKRITQGEAGTLLGVTDRQIRRLLRRVKQEGDQGLVHRGRGIDHSHGASGRIARGGRAKPMWASWSSSMGRTMTGWMGSARAGS